MRFEGLRLRNFRCYAETEVPFEPGVTVVHGPNGSGKSSLLDACFFALYGANTLDGTTLDEVITTGAETASVVLSFGHDGTTYDLEREIRIQGDRAQTATCELRAGEAVISGARAVRAEVARLLRMDADAFLNCAYVRQGEVNKLIQASPAERQAMIDELLQLGVLEEYRDRATAARRGIASLGDELVGQLEGLREQIERKEEKGLTETLNELETARKARERELEELAESVEEAEETRESARDVLDQYEERQEELAELETDISELREAIEEAEAEREEIVERITEVSGERSTVQESLATKHDDLGIAERDRQAVEDALAEHEERDEELREAIEDARVELQGEQGTAERADERVTELTERAAELEAEADEREEAIEADTEALADRREELEELRAEREATVESIEASDHPADEVDTAIEAHDAKRSELRDQESDLGARIEALRDDIAEAEALLEEGKCPTCGQEVAEAPHVTSIDADRERLDELEEELASTVASRETTEETLEELEHLAEQVRGIERLEDRIASVEELVDEKEATLADRRDDVASLRADAEDAREEAAEAESTAAAAREAMEGIRERIAELNGQRAELKETRNELESLIEKYDRREDLEAELDHLQERRDSIDALNDERRDRLGEKRDRRRELAEAVDEDRVEEAEASLEKAEQYLDQAAERRSDLERERDDLIDQIGGVKSELEELSALRERLDALEERADAVETAHADVEELESLYGRLRSELRERNVAALERMLNETFDLVYQNDAYDRIELDPEYRFTVYQKDGESLTPDQLSGGERALFNLSLRCAIYRLLSEGIEGAAPLPPLILDEPTVYLDEGHVGRLVDLVDSMRQLGVEQIILVTHDRELLRAADVTLTVEKNPTTNRSSVRASPVGRVPAAQD